MRFGIGIPSSHQGVYLPTPFAGPTEIVRIVQLAERLGYHSAWGLDFMTPWDDPIIAHQARPEWYEILITLAFLAARTRKIRLGTASLQLPLRDPFTVARQATTLDVLSGGRLMLGVGLGFVRIEFSRMRPHDSKSHRGQMFDEYLEALHRFLTEDVVSFGGKYYACDRLCLIPKPIQDPFPLYMTGVTNNVFDRIAKWSTGWLLARSQAHQLDERLQLLDHCLEKAGRSRKDIDLVVTKGLSIGRNREEAMERFYKSVLPARMDSVATELRISGEKPSRNISSVLQQNLIGSPDDVLEQIYELERKQIDHCVLYYNPVQSVEELTDQIQWFGEAVLPRSVGAG